MLVSGGVYEQFVAFADKTILQAHSHLHGMFSDLIIQTIGEQRLELYSEKSAFGKSGTMKFYQRFKARKELAPTCDDGFAEQCATFRSADIEHVRQ